MLSLASLQAAKIINFLTIPIPLYMVGSSTTNVSEAGRVSDQLWGMLAAAANGLLAVSVSRFPFSAPVAMVMRLSAAPVLPIWQIGFSLILLLLTIWLMARLFHVQTLLSDESLSMRRFVAALRG